MEKAQSKNYVQYNAFYRWFLSLINFYSRTAEERKCLYPTHEREERGTLVPRLLTCVLPAIGAKRRENKRVRTTLRKLKLLNSSWWKTNVEIQLRRAKMHTPIKVDHYPIMPHKYWCVIIRPHRLNKSTFSTSSQSAIHNLILQSTVTINPKKNNIPFSYRVYPFRPQKVCVQMWASAVRRITIIIS